MSLASWLHETLPVLDLSPGGMGAHLHNGLQPACAKGSAGNNDIQILSSQNLEEEEAISVPKKFIFGALFDKQFQAQLSSAASIFSPHIGRWLSAYSLFYALILVYT